MMMESKSFSIAELTLPLNIRSPIVFEREFSNGSYGNVVRTGKAAAVRCHPFRCLIRLDLLVRRSSLLWVWGVWASSPIAETYLCGFPIHEYCISILPSAPSLTVTVRRLPRCDRLKLLPTWRTPRRFLVRTSRSRTHCTRRGRRFDLSFQRKFQWAMSFWYKCYQKTYKLKKSVEGSSLRMSGF